MKTKIEKKIEDVKLIPYRKDDCFCPEIDIKIGQILNWEKGKTGDFLAINEEYGNYIIISVDENGFIQGWEFDKDCLEYFTEED